MVSGRRGDQARRRGSRRAWPLPLASGATAADGGAPRHRPRPGAVDRPRLPPGRRPGVGSALVCVPATARAGGGGRPRGADELAREPPLAGGSARPWPGAWPAPGVAPRSRRCSSSRPWRPPRCRCSTRRAGRSRPPTCHPDPRPRRGRRSPSGGRDRPRRSGLDGPRGARRLPATASPCSASCPSLPPSRPAALALVLGGRVLAPRDPGRGRHPAARRGGLRALRARLPGRPPGGVDRPASARGRSRPGPWPRCSPRSPRSPPLAR